MNKILKNGIYRIAEIEFWLLKYSDKYKKTVNICICGSKTDGLPCICERDIEDKLFLSMFNSFDELTEYL